MTIIMFYVKRRQNRINIHYLEIVMRYPAAETAEKHARIIEQAARLFRERGFSGVSVGEIMKNTGLTHGPFYNHFASKDALVTECLAYISEKEAAQLETWPSDAKGRVAYFAAYLSEQHRDDPGAGCAIAALAPEIARDAGTKHVFSSHVRATIGRLTARFPWSSKKNARRDAILSICAMAGALMIARAVDDDALSKEILTETLAALS